MKNNKLSRGTSTKEILEENEKIIKIATTFCIVIPIIYIGLVIAWIYFKSKGM